MSRLSVAACSALALCCFAGNSLLCRAALSRDLVDPASFTALRLVSGTATLWLILRARGEGRSGSGSWPAAAALFLYAAAFSLSYRGLTAATGALLLFGAVQVTMVGVARWRGERFGGLQLLGSVAAVGGLVYLVLPGVTAPPIGSAALMLIAGCAWGSYTLFGRSAVDALAETAGNFARTVPLTVALMATWWFIESWGAIEPATVRVGAEGAALAVASGALTSGVGYAIWYAALPSLPSITAAALQLSVPVLTGFGGALWLAEAPSARLVISAIATLGGIGLVIAASRDRAKSIEGESP